ncbi:MAG TPA: glycosyltransferase family 2 protein [Bacillota bacterium]|nr:glycosyltransferase family 2 protein [Bacillota bacterium]HOK69627.1 glycosyltransferase family 2 protein [Bacillota bacterium]HPP85200.1 glycosyltransferase family 2 protein [Bacillota bacterium]
MSDKPLISFIVTVYNLEKYIAKCLDSILNQNFDDYEIVVVDNASTDNSARICQTYAEKYPDKVRFYQVPKEMAAAGTAHYFGFNFAHGEYVQYIDGDDRLKENCLREIADLIITKKSDIIMGRYECYLEDSGENRNNIVDAAFEADKINNVSYDQALIYLSTLPNFHGVLWRYVFRKSLFAKSYKNVGGLFHFAFSSNIYSDGIMLIKLFLNANSITFLDKVIYIYTRRVDGSGKGRLDLVNLSKNSIISVLHGLYILISLKPKGGKRVYLINKINYIFEFYKSGLAYISEQQYPEIAQILEENIELLEGLKDCGIAELQDFYNLIKQYGCLNGAIAFSNQMHKSFFKQVEQRDRENLYLIPNGRKAISTLNLLRQNGYRLRAIFDNDPRKQGLLYEEVLCCSPQEIAAWDETRKSSATFIVSAMDKSLVKILINQLKGYGIQDTQIIVKE